MSGGDESVQLQQAKIEYYYSSATCQLKVKKDQQSLRFLLESKNVTFDDFDVCLDQMRKAEMQAKSGKASLPQLFVDDRFVGVRLSLSPCSVLIIPTYSMRGRGTTRSSTWKSWVHWTRSCSKRLMVCKGVER